MEHTLSLPLLLGMLMLALSSERFAAERRSAATLPQATERRHNHGEDRRGGRTRLRPDRPGQAPPIG